MKLIVIIATAIALALPAVLVAQDKRPTADECKKNPKLKGCDAVRK